MTATLIEQPFAAIWGILGMLCLVTWPLFRSRRTMLLVQLGIGVGFGVHYALLGAWTGALMNALSAIQVLAAIPIERRPKYRWIYYAIIPAIALASAYTWNGSPSVFAALAMLCLTIGRMQSNVLRLRILLLAAVPFWFTHDILVGSLPAVVADMATFATGAAMLLRDLPPPWRARLLQCVSPPLVTPGRSAGSIMRAGPA